MNSRPFWIVHVPQVRSCDRRITAGFTPIHLPKPISINKTTPSFIFSFYSPFFFSHSSYSLYLPLFLTFFMAPFYVSSNSYLHPYTSLKNSPHILQTCRSLKGAPLAMFGETLTYLFPGSFVVNSTFEIPNRCRRPFKLPPATFRLPH